MGIILKRVVKNKTKGCGLDSFGSEYVPVTSCREHGIHKIREFFLTDFAVINSSQRT
jgi:hypothetical protein